MVVKVHFKNKKANHTLWVDGEKVNFKNGVAEVDKETAKKIKALENPDYSTNKKTAEKEEDSDSEADKKKNNGNETGKK